MAIKRIASISAFLVFALLSASAEAASPRRFANSLLNDVAAMSHAGVPDETIVAYVKARQARLEEVSADDLIALRRAGVSESVVAYIAGVEGVEVPVRATGIAYESKRPAEASAEAPPPQEDVAYDYGSEGGWAWDGWWGYPYWPYWYAYSPYFAGTFVIRRGFDGRRFDGRRFDGGRRRGGGSGPGRRGGSGGRGTTGGRGRR